MLSHHQHTIVRILTILLLIIISNSMQAGVWPAYWIGSYDEQTESLHAAYFRKALKLSTVPKNCPVYVSADNRYKFYVNGVLVSWGPARSDLSNWNFETVDIAPYLKSGDNVLAAIVWNYGDKGPVAQMGTHEVAFLLCAVDSNSDFNTDGHWQVLPDKAYSTFDKFMVPGYFAASSGEQLNMEKYPWGWQTGNEDKNYKWLQARQIGHAFDKGTRDRGGRCLVPRSIPQMELSPISVGKIKMPFIVGAHSKKEILIDRDSLITAYLSLQTSGGKGARIEACYAEALFDHDMPDIWHATKHDRNDLRGKVMLGNKDVFIADGGNQRQMVTLWWRTWRYLKLTVETADEPLMIDSLGALFTAYPLKKESKLQAGSELRRMEEIGWRTARLCANETYMDCPYYEQLQYFGDTRLQAMITMYNTHDSLMPRHAIEQGRMSMTADGITQSRYPSSSPQMISSYSLSWIGSLHDYWLMHDDRAWLKRYLPAARSILAYYEGFLRSDMSLSHIPHWFFADWAKGLSNGEPNYGSDGTSAYQDLVFVLALREEAEMEKTFGLFEMGMHYDQLADNIIATVCKKYWNEERGLLADTREQNSYSQHVNTLAILAGVFDDQKAYAVCERVLSDTSLIQATFYFRYFVQQAMDKTGLANKWMSTLKPWQDQMALGLTTWAETPEPSRSDCHAWSDHLNIEFYRMLLGIHPTAPGFTKVCISPNLGKLKEASGTMPVPQGFISVSYKQLGKNLRAQIILPAGVEGSIVWNGKKQNIISGEPFTL